MFASMEKYHKTCKAMTRAKDGKFYSNNKWINSYDFTTVIIICKPFYPAHKFSTCCHFEHKCADTLEPSLITYTKLGHK